MDFMNSLGGDSAQSRAGCVCAGGCNNFMVARNISGCAAVCIKDNAANRNANFNIARNQSSRPPECL